MHNKRAFTLIELLVVLAIFAILVSILVPVSIKAIEMGNRAKCVNNLKSIGVAFTAYASEHGGALPHHKPLPEGGAGFQETPDFSAIVTKVYTNGYVTDLRVRANASYFLIFRRFDGTVSEWDAFFRFSREAKMIKSAYCWVNSMSRQYPAMAFFNSLTSLLGT